MAKQLNLLESGQIVPTAIHTEMERSYLEYAMSVIVGRALPDVRDGLKPVHRRILYAMHELGLTPDRPYRKCARVVGDVLGKYHPHGDQSVYDALVRMVQDFSSRHPLLSGHGNFGSVDNDPPAAMRYTETRLAEIAHQALLREIGEATVDFTSNFDNSQQEPVVLPAQLPILLLNGCSGIAVGMATNVPPHNLGEVVDGLIALIDKPNLPDEKLWQLIRGPDFPTGGEIIETAVIKEVYRQGRGSIPLRGVAAIEKLRTEGKRRRIKTAIVVTELPFQVNKAGWIEKVADLVNQGRLEGISDIRDESDRDGMRVVIELKRDTNAQQILRQLYKQTALQNNFGAIMLALVDNKPCQLSLRELLEKFLSFREQTLTRLYRYELEQNQRRIHLVEGLLAALKNLDRVIEILRNAPDGSTAKVTLQEELAISEPQADSILAMPMRRLTGLERQKLQTEYEELQEKIAELNKLLGDRGEFLKALKKELRSLKRKYGNPRRTKILSAEEVRKAAATAKKGQKSKKSPQKSSVAPVLSATEALPPKDAVIEVTRQGYVHWQTPSGGRKASTSNRDFVVNTLAVKQQEQLVVLTASGKAYPVALTEIPQVGNIKKTRLLSLLPKSVQKPEERVVGQFFLPQDKKQKPQDLVLLTKEGRIKRLAISELKDLSNRGLQVIKLKDKDSLDYACLAQEGQQMAIATTGGRILRFEVNDEQLAIMGRNAQGNQALRLRYNENLVSGVVVNENDSLLLVSGFGYAKRLAVKSLRLANRGDIGTQALQFAESDDSLVGLILAPKQASFTLLTATDKVISLPIKPIKNLGKDGTGNHLSKLKARERVKEIWLQ